MKIEIKLFDDSILTSQLIMEVTDMNNIYFSSVDFLTDVKYQIKEKYKNQSIYAKTLGYSRKALNRILNSGNNLTIAMIVKFCDDLNLNFENYLFDRRG